VSSAAYKSLINLATSNVWIYCTAHVFSLKTHVNQQKQVQSPAWMFAYVCSCLSEISCL